MKTIAQSGPVWGRLRSVGVYTIRVILAGCIVCAGVWALAGLSVLTGRRQPTADRQTVGETSPVAPWLAPADLSGGGWTIAGLPWRLSVERLPPAEVEAELMKPPSLVPDAREADEKERELLRLARLLGAQRRSESGCRIYVFRLEGVRIALYSTGAGRYERPILGRIAYGREGASSVLFEASPQPAGLKTGKQPLSYLLPLPSEFRRLAVRRGKEERVLADLASVDAGATALCDLWRRSGWRTEALLGEGGRVRGVTCWQGETAVQVWLLSTATDRESTLVLQVAVDPLG